MTDDEFYAALAAAGWSREQYEAHLDELVADAPPLPPVVVDILRRSRERR